MYFDKSRIGAYSASGRAVYQLNKVGAEVKIEKCATPEEAKARAEQLNRERIVAQTAQMSEAEYYQATGQMGLTDEDHDF